MDLEECASAYDVKGGLKTPEPSTTEVKAESVSTSTPTSTPSSTPIVTETITTPVTTTECETTSQWTSPNATVTTGYGTSTPVVPLPPVETSDVGEPEPTQPTGAASGSGVSLAFLVAAAGFVALF